MRLLKRTALALLAAAIVSQLPFIYRRHQLLRLRQGIAALAAQRMPPVEDGFKEVKGVIHVHSLLGGHSLGTFDEIIRAAQINQLDFVVMTEHPESHVATAEATLRGVHEGVLFVNGSEVETADGDRLLIFPGSAAEDPSRLPTRRLIAEARSKGQMTAVAYPRETGAWKEEWPDGLEVYNLYTNARRARTFPLILDAIWSWWSYPDLIFARFYERPDDALRIWDEALKGRRLFAIAGNDAHANIGLGLRYDSGKPIFDMRFDPYETSFHLVRNHVLLAADEPLTAETLQAALSRGHSFIAFDLFSDATGFRFMASDGRETKIMGDQIAATGDLQLTVRTPLPSHIRLLKDGEEVAQAQNATSLTHRTSEPGVYRVEVYLDQLPLIASKPWIISNPIRVVR